MRKRTSSDRRAKPSIAVPVHNHPVDQPVVRRLVGREEAVALEVDGDLLLRLAGVLRVDLLHALAQGQRLAGVDLDVGRLPLEAAGRLVDEDPAVGERRALARRAAGQDQRAHRHGDAAADRGHVGLDEAHRVVDRQPGVDHAARRVDVHLDVLVGVIGLQMQQLRDDEVGDRVVDRLADEDDPLAQQARIDVERALAARVLLNDHGYEWHYVQPPSCVFLPMVASSATHELQEPRMPVVNREVVLPCDRERAWELITEPSELEGWLADEVEFEPAEDAPVRIEDREGVVESVVEGERIVFRWGDSRVEWALTDAPGGTRFEVIEHRYVADTVTWGPKLMAMSAAASLCLA